MKKKMNSLHMVVYRAPLSLVKYECNIYVWFNKVCFITPNLCDLFSQFFLRFSVHYGITLFIGLKDDSHCVQYIIYKIILNNLK